MKNETDITFGGVNQSKGLSLMTPTPILPPDLKYIFFSVFIKLFSHVLFICKQRKPSF